MTKNNDKNIQEIINNEIASVQTTIGDLIEAISNISLGICSNKEEAYEITSKRVSEILYQNNKLKDLELSL